MSHFYAVLIGKRKESIYISQRETASQLLKEMTNADTQNEGLITMEQLSTILKNTFPLKKEEQIQELMETAGWTPDISSTEVLNYRILFTEDEEGQSEPFVQKLWEQYDNEKDAYLQELKQDLGLEQTDDVSLWKMRVALMNIDPSLDKQMLNTYLSQAFQLPVAELLLEEDEKQQEEIVVKLETALDRLRMADTKRVGPRESEQAS